jgi:acyl-CoA synthetase (AMP-forming)/AMP-acid ligase II
MHGWRAWLGAPSISDSGRLYVCGRTKHVIVVSGSNLYPTDIDRAAADVDGVHRGCAAAVRIDAGAEREGFAVLLAEVRSPDGQCQRTITREIVARVNSRVGHAPWHPVFGRTGERHIVRFSYDLELVELLTTTMEPTP